MLIQLGVQTPHIFVGPCKDILEFFLQVNHCHFFIRCHFLRHTNWFGHLTCPEVNLFQFGCLCSLGYVHLLLYRFLRLPEFSDHLPIQLIEFILPVCNVQHDGYDYIYLEKQYNLGMFVQVPIDFLIRQSIQHIDTFNIQRCQFLACTRGLVPKLWFSLH